jgi:DNA-binding LacI/PurR family transcriptional regulator
VSSIHEVAKRAGVSTATVSRALSRPDLVSPQTRRTYAQMLIEIVAPTRRE